MTEGWDGDDAGRKFAKAVLFGFLPLALAATGVFFWATAPSNGGGEEVVADSPQPAVNQTASQPDVVEAAAESMAQTPSGQGPNQGPPAVNARRVASAQASQTPAPQQGSG
ncbi:MAG: hypothetical protein ACO3J2_10040, partial [Chthoniobacterales bacterium]